MIKKSGIYAIVMVVLVFLIPIIVVSSIPGQGSNSSPETGQDPAIEQSDLGDLDTSTPPHNEDFDEKTVLPSKTIKVYISRENKIEEMDFENYLVGVLTGEMPASYEIEALKAQAVAARSFILSRMEAYQKYGGVPEHNGGDICTTPEHCKAWLSAADAESKWGDGWIDTYYNKLVSAVNDTRGEYMTYENQVVKAFFHANSSGKTENVSDVWGGENLPYLKSVSSEGDETSPAFESQVEVDEQEFIKKLKDHNKGVKETKPIQKMIGSATLTEGGNVNFIELGGQNFKGTEVRQIFGLRSANFTIQASANSVVFHVKGYGHGVGMSQYGANFLAKQGKSYEEILNTYYIGVEKAFLTY